MYEYECVCACVCLNARVYICLCIYESLSWSYLSVICLGFGVESKLYTRPQVALLEASIWFAV